MAIKRLLVCSMAVVIIAAQLGGSASAHVLIRDTSGRVGGILHVTPDDDPVAGEIATLNYDIQDPTFSSAAYDVSLEFHSEETQNYILPVQTTSGSFAIRLLFPRQGLYQLSLIAKPKSGATVTPLVFNYAQRVSRGTKNSTTVVTPAWTDIGMFAAPTGLVLLGIIAYNRRKSIAKYSVW